MSKGLWRAMTVAAILLLHLENLREFHNSITKVACLLLAVFKRSRTILPIASGDRIFRTAPKFQPGRNVVTGRPIFFKTILSNALEFDL